MMPFLTSCASMPMLTACQPSSTIATNDDKIYVDNNAEVEKGACTITYVGKDVSTTGLAMIARCCDTRPRSANLRMKVHERDELANKTITSYDGFSYKMPEHTYRYISAPVNAKSSIPGGAAN